MSTAADPVNKPWVVRRYYRTDASGCHGWGHGAMEFSTESAAIDAHKCPLGGRYYRSELLNWRQAATSTGWKLALVGTIKKAAGTRFSKQIDQEQPK